ncbi:MAG: ParB/RepB/Spo0J family partition protein [Candidatus Thiodiazotropha sp. (ex Lucina aurantia)]|nr:ParB/RepB/Spo0J family partition protein [Candidatus Thiodiazotropha taylori]MBV2097838.1 ParB/RepB/Spo0J family partition protein [Candidatus Thiodiazotropha sp. (ex Codakia orbicularis)]MBV2103289.1 ParB/RepB/Spo0J family partition protein [Candidatus Thiodiazotropha sp. (ex Lucina aurantia)]MBV2116348.1 ParB/RepB/Spo0J family partition protein [Candidatus Thiodiazotropha sp. (ex Lucina aurantia)]
MTIQTIPLSRIKPSKDNPRKTINDETIEELAISIAKDGVLQNLVVAKPKGRKRTYHIICGERRYRALCLLVEQGTLDKDFLVPVKVEDDVSEQDIHRIATVENLQREDMPPLEEADAVAALLQEGMTLDDVVSQTGISASTIKRRLALSGLCDHARTSLILGDISLSQAEALTIGTHDQQRELIESNIHRYDAEHIKDILTDTKASVSIALFSAEEYSGTYASDLFREDETTYFDDVEQFMELQMRAVQQQADKYQAEGFDPVEIIEGFSFSEWQYRPATDDEKGGVVIHVHPSGRVEIHEGIVNRDLDKQTAEETADNPFVEKKPKLKYSNPVRDYIAMHKSIAVQAALLDNPRTAKEVSVIQLICSQNGLGKLSRLAHKCHPFFAKSEAQPSGFRRLDEIATELLIILDKQNDEYPAYSVLLPKHGDHETSSWYKAVKTLTDDELDRLHLLLTTLTFGQYGSNLDTDEESLFNLVANDLGVDMRDYWMPEDAFLSRLGIPDLLQIVTETATSRLFGTVGGHKKKDIVRMLADHFEHISTVENPSEAELIVKNWLPEVFSFPAVDPDREQKEPEPVIEEEEPLAIAA